MRLLNPSLGRKTLGPAQLLELAAPRPQVGPMPRGGVRLGPAAQVPRWDTSGKDWGTQLMEGLERGLAISARADQSRIAQERLALQKQATKSQISERDARVAETKRLAGARDALASGIYNAGLPSLVGDEADGAYKPPMSPQDYLGSPEGVGLLIDMLSPDAIARLSERKPTPMQSRIAGTEQVQERWNPATRAWAEVSRGPRWNPKTGTLTQAQQRESIEIGAARKRVQAHKFSPGVPPRKVIGALIEKKTKTGRDNPAYNEFLDKDVNLARRRMVGADPGYDSFMTWLDQPTPQPAPVPGTPAPSGDGASVPPPPYLPPPREPMADTAGLTSTQRARRTVDARARQLSPPADFLDAMPEAQRSQRGLVDWMLRQSGEGDVPESLRPRSLPEALSGAVSALPGIADRVIYGDAASRPPPVPRPKPTMRARNLGRGRGTQAQPFRPKTDAEFRVIKPGEYYVNPADGKTYRKK